MNVETAIKHAAWILTLNNVRRENVRVVKLVAGGREFFGVRFTQYTAYGANGYAVRSGENAAGDVRVEEVLDVLGARPLFPAKGFRKDEFVFAFEGKEWYVTYYAGPDSKPSPQGHTFGLKVWDARVCNGVIDAYTTRPYQRVPTECQELVPATTVTAHMLAGMGGDAERPTRTIELPAGEFDAGLDDLDVAALAYKYGQNDFQSRPVRSVSMGDVLECLGQFFLVVAFGFRRLTADELAEYRATPPRERQLLLYLSA
jgi:hypothetical protein